MRKKREKHLPCVKCGSTADEYLYTCVDQKTFVEEKDLCLECVKERKSFKNMESECS